MTRGVDAHGRELQVFGQAARGELLAEADGVRRRDVEGGVHEVDRPHPVLAHHGLDLVGDQPGVAQAVGAPLDVVVGAVDAAQGAAALGLDGVGGAVGHVGGPVDPAPEVALAADLEVRDDGAAGGGLAVEDAVAPEGAGEVRAGPRALLVEHPGHAAQVRPLLERLEEGRQRRLALAGQGVVGLDVLQDVPGRQVDGGAADDDLGARAGLPGAAYDLVAHLIQVEAGRVEVAVVHVADGDADDLGLVGRGLAQRLLRRVAGEGQVQERDLVPGGLGGAGDHAEPDRRRRPGGLFSVGVDQKNPHHFRKPRQRPLVENCTTGAAKRAGIYCGGCFGNLYNNKMVKY
jgi:hypothetical protein